MNNYEKAKKLFMSTEYGPNTRAFECALLEHDFTDYQICKIESILENCEYKPSIRDLDQIEMIAANARQLPPAPSLRQIQCFR